MSFKYHQRLCFPCRATYTNAGSKGACTSLFYDRLLKIIAMSSVLRTACDSCHARKSRCVSEGGDICQLCRQRGLTCVFSPRNTMGRPPRQSSPSSPYQCTSWELQLDAPCQPSYSGNGISSISPPLSHAPSSTWQLTDWPLESIGTFQPPGYEATFVADPSLPTPFLSNAASDLAILDTAMQNQESLPEQHFAEAFWESSQTVPPPRYHPNGSTETESSMGPPYSE